MTHCCWESAALSCRRRLLTIVWVARDVCDFIMVSHQVFNSPRLIYYFSNMTSRLSGNISVFGLVLIVLKSLLETARQCSREKFAINPPFPFLFKRLPTQAKEIYFNVRHYASQDFSVGVAFKNIFRSFFVPFFTSKV